MDGNSKPARRDDFPEIKVCACYLKRLHSPSDCPWCCSGIAMTRWGCKGPQCPQLTTTTTLPLSAALLLMPPPPAQDRERIFQKNEGQWEFSLQEDDAGRNLELEVDVGKFLDTSLIKVRVPAQSQSSSVTAGM